MAHLASAPLLFIDAASEVSLQDQLRRQLTEAAISGAFPAGKRLPSSRVLADQLGLSRNTVILACQKLIDEGLFISRERSGLYVNPALLKGRVSSRQVAGIVRQPAEPSAWTGRFKRQVPAETGRRRLPQWRQYPYPFLDGLFDESLFPVQEWRESMRQALGVREINAWSVDSGDADDPTLIDEIRAKILTRRGIKARPDEILITSGSQQALSLLVQVLVDKSVTVAVEEPGYPDLRRLIAQNGGRIVHQGVDSHGMIIDGCAGADIICVTPSHQYPTGATLSLDRRQALLDQAEACDQVVIEDDYACETNYLEQTLPALYSLDGGRRVIYVAGLSKVLSPGLRLGFIVAAPEVINAARALRRLLTRHPPMNIQRAASFFLAMGHYDATMMRTGLLFRERRTALRDALNHYMRDLATIMPLRGGTTYWVQGPPELDVQALIALAERNGVLIESAAPYYGGEHAPRNEFLVGATSLPLERIRSGVAVLRDCIRQLLGYPGAPVDSGQVLTTEPDLRRALSGCSILYRTVYADPCTIELLPDGAMLGRAGYANEDCDAGRWWIEEGKWCRQWQSWAYGEVSRYDILIDGGRIYWLNDAGQAVDSAIYIRPE